MARRSGGVAVGEAAVGGEGFGEAGEGAVGVDVEECLDERLMMGVLLMALTKLRAKEARWAKRSMRAKA